MIEKLKRKLRSNYDTFQRSKDDSSETSLKKILVSIIQNRHNSNEDKSKQSLIENSHDYLKPVIAFYQNHKHLDLNAESNKMNKLMQKYPIRISSSSSSPPQEPDSIESTTSPFISFSNSYSSVSSLPSSHYDEFTNHHKTNEFYSIFVSVITAAVFLFFIMWRWFKMNSDFRKALREQLEIQQHVRTNPAPATSTNNTRYSHTNRSSRMALLPVNRWTNSYSFILPNNREELQTTASHLIAQLSNGEYRTARQHQQMIDRARYCLQQLKLHARLTQYQRQQQQQRRANPHNYSTFNSNTDRSNIQSCDYSPSTSSSLSPLSLTEHSSTDSLCQAANAVHLPPVPPVSITSLQTLTSYQTNESFSNRARNSSTFNLNNQQRILTNEPPPDYESLMIKSCSLPSYANLKDNKTEKNTN